MKMVLQIETFAKKIYEGAPSYITNLLGRAKIDSHLLSQNSWVKLFGKPAHDIARGTLSVLSMVQEEQVMLKEKRR